MSRLIIVRHGNTFAAGEPARRIGARTDLPLTKAGEAQARELGRKFRQHDLRFGRALAGPLKRARDSAALLLAELCDPPPLVMEPMLDEIDHGPDESQPEAAVRARIGEAALADWDCEGTPPEGWRVDRAARLAWWQAMLDEAGDQTTLLVTSNGAARFALLALGRPLAPAGLKLRTGAFGILDRDAGSWRVSAWDQRPDQAWLLAQ